MMASEVHGLKRGDRIRVRKGALVFRMGGGPRQSLAGTSYRVTFDHLLNYGDRVTVRWAGSGGYWNETACANVEKVVG